VAYLGPSPSRVEWTAGRYSGSPAHRHTLWWVTGDGWWVMGDATMAHHTMTIYLPHNNNDSNLHYDTSNDEEIQSCNHDPSKSPFRIHLYMFTTTPPSLWCVFSAWPHQHLVGIHTAHRVLWQGKHSIHGIVLATIVMYALPCTVAGWGCCEGINDIPTFSGWHFPEGRHGVWAGWFM